MEPFHSENGRIELRADESLAVPARKQFTGKQKQCRGICDDWLPDAALNHMHSRANQRSRGEITALLIDYLSA